MSLAIPDSVAYDIWYNKAFRYFVAFFSPDEDKLLYVSNGFDPTASNIVVTQISINQAQWDTWSDSVTIDDSVYNNLDQSIFDNGMVMKIWLGKRFNLADVAFYGIVDAIGPSRTGLGKIAWTIYAKGFGVVPNYTFCDFQKAPPPETMSTNAIVSNPSSIPFFANNLVKSIFGDIDIMPLLDYTLSERMGKDFTLAFVSSAVRDFIPGIKQPLAAASALISTIARMSGAIWYIDQYKRLQFRYPNGDNQGVLIKDYWEPGDSGDFTAYIKPGQAFSYVDSTRPEDGFAQQLFAIAEKTDQIGINTRAISFTSLFDKNIAFAVYPGVAKFSNMTFMLSKVGSGSNEANPAVAKIRGKIITDNKFQPTGTPIADFAIAINDIPDTPTPIVKIDRPQFKDLQIDKLHWIMFFASGSSEANTVRVWHDDNRQTPSTPDNPRYSAIQFLKDGVTNKAFSKKNWYTSSQGPAYSIAFATTSNMIIEASDPASIEKWSPGRPVQARATIPTLKNIDAAKQYLQILVSQTAQKIRNYGNLTVSIPNILIQPGTEVQLVSDKLRDLYFENNTMATVKSVNYNLDVANYAVGSKSCDITLRGYVSAYS